MIILDGKKYRDELLERYKETISKEKLSLGLSIILIGNNSASEVYVKNKVKYSTYVGINTQIHRLSEDVTLQEVLKLIDKLNSDSSVNGIILQSPVPHHIDFDSCIAAISPKKDVDGISASNIFSLYQNKKAILPCTVKGIIKLLEHYNIDVEGKNITIIGRSEIVGKPLALALNNRNATVTLCHSKTKNIKDITSKADILISAVGKANFITNDMVKEGFIGIDVGINHINGRLYGDFNYEEVKDLASYITPVPGGVGPMTIAMIIDNLIELKRME